MADEETKALLRELIILQQMSLDLEKRRTEISEAQDKEYAESNSEYRASKAAWKIATVIRAIALLGVVLIIGYIVVFGLHTH